MTTGLSGRGWDLDLHDGKEQENELRRILGDSKLELKTDKKCPETGNVFIELSQTSGPSGFNVTESEYWAFQYMDGRFLLIPVSHLRDMVRLACKLNYRAMGGDDDKQKGVLIPIGWLTRPFISES